MQKSTNINLTPSASLYVGGPFPYYGEQELAIALINGDYEIKLFDNMPPGNRNDPRWNFDGWDIPTHLLNL
jgi:hypothetical protein